MGYNKTRLSRSGFVQTNLKARAARQAKFSRRRRLRAALRTGFSRILRGRRRGRQVERFILRRINRRVVTSSTRCCVVSVVS